jgi:serine/threonine-protein kinase
LHPEHYTDESEDLDLAFCQESLKRKYLTHKLFQKCLLAHAEIKRMGLSKPTIRDIVISMCRLSPEKVTRVMAIVGARSGKRAIKGYRLLEKVTSGAFGSIYKARQESMDRVVALKVLPRRLALNPRYVKNFMRETKLAAQLAHENIVYVLDAGQSAGLLYLAMDFIEGETLETQVHRSGPLAERKLIGVTWALAQALSHAHRTGILHRDIKPANVVMQSSKTPKLCDFGLAKSTAREALMEASGVIVGTPSYMAPEQILGEKVDERSDIYGLGATLYFMITGKPPFPAGKSFAEVYENQIVKSMLPPTNVNPDCPPQVDRLVRRMMQRDPARRFQSAVELVDTLLEMARSN